ncbi:MAG: hypothetical protein Kow0098_18060 [Ignavibacteriaceae bacterium]
MAQKVYFCEGVDEDGYPINEAYEFTIPSSGGYLYVLCRLPYRVNSSEVIMDIFRVNRSGNEEFDNTLYIDTNRDWAWFWKKVTFYDAGTYAFYLYDEDENYLASGEVKISYR